MKRIKLPRHKHRVKRWEQKKVVNSGPHREGMHTLYGSSSPTRQQSLHHLRRETPTPVITRDMLDAARHQGLVERRDEITGEVCKIDPVSPLVRIVLRRQAERALTDPLRTLMLYESDTQRVDLLYTKSEAFLVRHRKYLKLIEYSITYSSLSRALTVFKDGSTIYKECISC